MFKKYFDGTDEEEFDANAAIIKRFAYVPDLSNSKLCCVLLEQYLLLNLLLLVEFAWKTTFMHQ